MKQRKGWIMSRMSCDVGEATGGLESEQSLYVTAHSIILLSLHLCHRHFTYVFWGAIRGLTLVLRGGGISFKL